jgi:sigma-E processing peptidase SpoIIGA
VDKVWHLCRLTCAYLAVAAICAGITYALALSGTVRTGEPLPSIAWWLVLGGPALLTLPIQRIWSYVRARIGSLRRETRLRFTLFGRVIEVDGSLDTGNTLLEPFSSRPVIIVNPSVLETVLPAQCLEQLMFRPEDSESMDRLANVEAAQKMVFIPFTTVSDSGVMLGLRPEKCEVLGSAGWQEVKVVLGLGRRDVELAGKLALVPASILSGEM